LGEIVYVGPVITAPGVWNDTRSKILEPRELALPRCNALESYTTAEP
jgi:hypothetical protein